MWFYTGFAQILSLGRRNKMVGIAEQYQYMDLKKEKNFFETRVTEYQTSWSLKRVIGPDAGGD